MQDTSIYFYRQMLKIRRFEDKLESLFMRGLIHGTAHFCKGQEAIPVGICAELTAEDFVTSTHRGHGHALSKGLDIGRFMAELMGRSEGYNKGRGGTQHTMSKEHNFMSNGITGGMVAVGCGIALSNKLKNNKRVVVSFFGDGAMNEGYVQEALNLAAVLELPILFVCENNFYAMSTSVNKAFKTPICKRAESYGIRTERIDGNNVLNINAVAKEFIGKIRKGEGPFFVECLTYRHCGHSKNDLNLYRPDEEEKEWFAKDPLIILKNKLLEGGDATEEELCKIDSEIKKEIEDGVKFATESPEVDKKTLLDNLYAK